jgi:mono/diheme cytochrome c family protein
MLNLKPLIMTLTLTVAYAGTALAAGDAEAGKKLVINSCSSCHATATATVATDTVPPLSFLAKDNKRDPDWIRAWLMEPHPPMPRIMLSRRQIDDVIAYLQTLPTTDTK